MNPDSELDHILKLLKQIPPIWDIPLDVLRKYTPEFDELLGLRKEEVGGVEDASAEGRGSRRIMLRIYRPIENRRRYSTVVFYHGGGFVLGGIQAYDNLCRMITNASCCRVVSVDYRLAPEHKFPAAVEDAFDALKWVIANVDSGSVAVMGDSAGGNLAAVAAQLAAREGLGLSYQVLVYPVLLQAGISPSTIENSEAPGLTSKEMRWFGNHYFKNPADRLSTLASPLLAEDLAGLPPAMIVTAELDPLRDQGEMYDDRLRGFGIPVVGVRYSGMIHGFFSYMGTASGLSALSSVGAVLRNALYKDRKGQ